MMRIIIGTLILHSVGTLPIKIEMSTALFRQLNT